MFDQLGRPCSHPPATLVPRFGFRLFRSSPPSPHFSVDPMATAIGLTLLTADQAGVHPPTTPGWTRQAGFGDCSSPKPSIQVWKVQVFASAQTLSVLVTSQSALDLGPGVCPGITLCCAAGIIVCWAPGIIDGCAPCVCPGIMLCCAPGIIVCWAPGIIVCWVPGIIDCCVPGIIDCCVPGIIIC